MTAGFNAVLSFAASNWAERWTQQKTLVIKGNLALMKAEAGKSRDGARFLEPGTGDGDEGAVQ